MFQKLLKKNILPNIFKIAFEKIIFFMNNRNNNQRSKNISEKLLQRISTGLHVDLLHVYAFYLIYQAYAFMEGGRGSTAALSYSLIKLVM